MSQYRIVRKMHPIATSGGTECKLRYIIEKKVLLWWWHVRQYVVDHKVISLHTSVFESLDEAKIILDYIIAIESQTVVYEIKTEISA